MPLSLLNNEEAANMKKFTLIELLVVVAIIGILVSLVLPALSKARRASQLSVSLNNMRQINMAVSMYALDHEDQLMPAQYGNITWDDYISEYLGINMTDADKDSATPTYHGGFKIYACPLDSFDRGQAGGQERYVRTYQVNAFNDAVNEVIFSRDGTTDESIKLLDLNAPSDTILLNEMAKDNNRIGGTSQCYMAGPTPLNWVTDTVTDTNDPNHHKNGFRNPVILGDGHGKVMYMPTTKANDNYLWLSKVAK